MAPCAAGAFALLIIFLFEGTVGIDDVVSVPPIPVGDFRGYMTVAQVDAWISAVADAFPQFTKSGSNWQECRRSPPHVPVHRIFLHRRGKGCVPLSVRIRHSPVFFQRSASLEGANIDDDRNLFYSRRS